MIANNIYFQQQTQTYLVLNHEYLICNYCQSNFDDCDVVLIVEKYNTEYDGLTQFCCKHCTSKIKFTHKQEHRKVGAVFDHIPTNCLKYIPRPVELVQSNNIFAASNLKSDRTRDNTIHAGRENFEDIKVGNDEYIQICKEKDYLQITNKDLAVEYIQSLGKPEKNERLGYNGKGKISYTE